MRSIHQIYCHLSAAWHELIFFPKIGDFSLKRSLKVDVKGKELALKLSAEISEVFKEALAHTCIVGVPAHKL